MSYKRLRASALRCYQLAATKSKHYAEIESWCEFADALMLKIEWPETLWEPSPLHDGTLSAFFKYSQPEYLVTATMRVRVDATRDFVDVEFHITKKTDSVIVIRTGSGDVLWNSKDRELPATSVEKAHDHIVKCFRNAATGSKR